SENKHALVEYDDGRPEAGLIARSADGRIVAYVGLAPAAGGDWAMEIVAGENDPGGLVAAASDAARRRGAKRLRRAVCGRPLSEWPQKLGFSPERRLLIMARPLPADEAPQFPEGIAVGPFRRGVDEQAWLEVNNAAFTGHPENGDLTREDLERRMAMDWFDP